MLSLILPTYNEAENLPSLLSRLQGVLSDHDEVIVVDDNSPDETWKVAEHLRKQYPFVQVLRRIDKRGLSSAVVDGFAMAKGNVLMVMDSDLQHDPAVITKLCACIEQGTDIAVASRYIAGGDVGSWVRGRRILSRTATLLAQWLPNVRSSDPMSGFFALKADRYRAIADTLHPTGFKILLEVLAFLPRKSVIKEVPLKFQLRTKGESKLSMKVQIEFALQVIRIAFVRCSMPIFWLLCAVLAFFALHRIWNMRALVSSEVRTHVYSQLTAYSEKTGILLSDLDVQKLTPTTMEVRITRHHRGPDERSCMVIDLHSGATSVCVED